MMPLSLYGVFFKVELTSSYKHALYSVNATHVYISKQYAMTYTNNIQNNLIKTKILLKCLYFDMYIMVIWIHAHV